MRGMTHRQPHLFNEVEWHTRSRRIQMALSEEVTQLDGNRLLNTSVEDLCEYFEKKYHFDVPIIQEDEIVADQRETKIDVSQERQRDIRDRSKPFLIDGAEIEITIPFVGDASAFNIQPSTFSMSPPIGEIRGDRLVLLVEGVDLQAEKVQSAMNSLIADIKRYLDNLRTDAQALNSQLRTLARNAIDNRGKKLLKNQNLVASLGFALKERPDSPRTFVAPEVRRKISPVLPIASSAPYEPEPTLSSADYEHILGVLQNMVLVMERSPSAFSSMDEESMRFHFLVQLNGHYEGDATGETFNSEGKTDILIRSQGRNIFIAECKYWDGPQMLSETIDQLQGYSSWRDTKVAVIIFNRRKNFTRVLEVIPSTVEKHPNFKRKLGEKSETSFQYVFSHKDDPNREMILTVMAFDVPSKEEGAGV